MCAMSLVLGWDISEMEQVSLAGLEDEAVTAPLPRSLLACDVICNVQGQWIAYRPIVCREYVYTSHPITIKFTLCF